jgi:hypothetical protein
MKKQEENNKKGFLKKIFIKICRIFGYEIIDQSTFHVPTQNKNLDEDLNIAGTKSINLPLGEIKISRKVNALTVIFRSCTNINMLTQNKQRLFEKNKAEYTFRSLNSVILSLKQAKKIFPKIDFNIVVIDHESKAEDIIQIKKQLENSKFTSSTISLDVNNFIPKINKVNSKNESVTENQMSNMSNIHKSLIMAKDQCKDLIYFVEDDYIHQPDAIEEMIYTYERISSQLNRELILCPADYPYLYTKIDSTNIFLGAKRHWRKIDETLCTFLTSNILIIKHWDKLISMCQFEHYPFEQPLHEIYKNEYCLSPIPSLAFHCTNINSIFGLSPNINWKNSWDENADY